MKVKHLVASAIAFGMLAGPVSVAAKKQPQLSALELQSLQTRDFESSKAVVFAAAISVLQDSGYRITAADKDTGLITGTASTTSKASYNLFTGFGRKKKTPIVSVFIEELQPNYTKTRFSFVLSEVKKNQFGGSEDEEPIIDPQVYKDAFEKMEQAIFVRQATHATPSAPAAETMPTDTTEEEAPSGS